MPTYKDEKTGNWYCKFYYTNWQGEKKSKFKRGFTRKKDALEWERQFLEQFSKNPDISFEELYKRFKEYKVHQLRESTSSTLFSILEKHVVPYFKNRVVSDITPADIVQWQTEMLGKGLSESYIHTINVQLKAIFNHAVDFLGLTQNPCKKSVGTKKRKKITFWTPEEYKQFIDTFEDDIECFTIFEILYYTGMREGEALALTVKDIDIENKKIDINKTKYRIKGKDLINPPKTANSERVVDIPGFLVEEIKEYITHIYKPEPDTELFNIKPLQVWKQLKRHAEDVGLKEIRVHDLRHSHASTLINLGANPVLVAERLGHESPAITLETYSHLFPHKQAEIVAKIEKIK